ncbi:hypothetical protein H1W37_17290 [Stappia taiwanensis]|uniref:Uncharacterized protein n=1 Tax=Stappia taiwanensis TaxID=992267 RepID=A0A838XY08_9HYPH|nr:hypothetical protein [Stappia taiwanensis]MBA4613418.1 hypothetical protein [Stappia taiwanensis]
MDDLEDGLRKFDGTAISSLSEIRAACRGRAGYLNELAAFCADARASVSAGATWLLKAELAEGVELAPEVTAQIVGALDRVVGWQAALHLCQSVEMLELTSAQAGRFLEWARGYADHARPFLRAWSLHARAILGHRFPEFEDEAAIALRTAEADAAASVRARARNLRKLLGAK